MPKKRSSGGRSKGSKGRSGLVQCSYCGALVPRDKAKKITRWSSVVDPRLWKELKKMGARISRYQVTRYACISCAVHYGIVKIRSKEERKLRTPIRRR
ncbi:30S ribosomal protein S26e [Candidatus Bathyarchaeota archaeon]|nr:MAG: 30S ribosomal protein S26e [Candidatus Bathyarchaeota archaeon]